MRGSPLLRALIAFLAILALGYPLRRLTGGGNVSTAAPVAIGKEAKSEIKLQLTFTTPSKKFSVRHLGREVWTGESVEGTAERALTISYPAEGVELQLAADFPDGAPLAAVRCVLIDPQGDEHQKSCWGTGHIDEVIAFP